MGKNKLEIIFDYAYQNYDELSINANDKDIIKYTVFINDFNNTNELFNELGVPVSLCYDKKLDLHYIECCSIKLHLQKDQFLTYKNVFMIKYYKLLNEEKSFNLSQLNKLYDKIKEKNEERNRNALSEIIRNNTYQFYNVDAEAELTRILRDEMHQTFVNNILSTYSDNDNDNDNNDNVVDNDFNW
jgi:hypothetical protein